ncbi:MAG: gamma-glutamylputrescine oxidase, partial [Myxococcota bacterium]
MRSTPHWLETTPPAPTAPPSTLPQRADVVVIGGGQAGLSAAAHLAEGGASVVVLEARSRLGAGMSGRSAGLGLVGIGDNPHRLRVAIGDTASAEILQFSLENLSLLEELGVLERTGGIATSKGSEIDEIPLTVEAATALGVPCELWSAEQVSAALGTEGLGPGRFTPAEGLVDPAALIAALAQRATAAGAILLVDAQVADTRDLADGIEVLLSDGRRIEAEVVVLASGWSLKSLDPWLGDKIYPTRSQQITLSCSAPQPRYAVTAQYGYAYWRPVSDDVVLVGGCRWATPHLESGESDDTVVVPVIEERIQGFAAQHLPALSGPVLRRWTGIMAFTCDLLPLLGPVPGRPRFVL